MRAVYPNDSDQEILSYVQVPTIVDYETFFHLSFGSLTRLLLGNQPQSRQQLQQKLLIQPTSQYIRSIITNRIGRFQIQKDNLFKIDGKKYKQIVYSEIMYRISEHHIMCCICETQIQLKDVEQHSDLCMKKAKLKQQLVQLQEQVQGLQEDATAKEVEFITKFNMYKRQNNASYQNSPVMMRIQPPQQLSKFGQRSLHRAKTISEQTQVRTFNRQRIQSNSPESSKYIRNAISLLKIIQQYCQKTQNIYSFENDVRTTSILKIGQSDTLPQEVGSMIKRCMDLCKERIELNKQINRLDALSKSINNPAALKKAFQKGLSNSYKDHSTSSSRRGSVSKGTRIMDQIKTQTKSRFFKEDQNEVTTPLSTSTIPKKINIDHYNDSDEVNFSADEFIRGYFSDQGKQFLPKSRIINIGLKDFEFLDILGVGAYGAVWKVKKISTKDVYAMKVIDTSERKSKNFIKTLKAEKDVFSIIEGDFIAKAYYSFSQADCLFYLLEYVKGGDFDRILRKYGALDEHVAKFYLAELLLAIEALHNKNIIHRDLKPQNILLDSQGHIKLADFGLSELGMKKKIQLHSNEHSKALELQETLKKNIKEILPESELSNDKQEGSAKISAHKHRIVGTPDYIAPEVIKGISITNESLDLWSFGVLVYEYLVGIPPFNDDTPEKIFENIINRAITWPEIGDREDQISVRAKDLIEKLLDMNYETRLNVQQAKDHEFFKGNFLFIIQKIQLKKGINFETIRQQKAPIIPTDDTEDLPVTQFKKQREKEKLNRLLKDASSDSTISKLGVLINFIQVDNLLRLDLLVEMNQQKAKEIRKKRFL